MLREFARSILYQRVVAQRRFLRRHLVWRGEAIFRQGLRKTSAKEVRWMVARHPTEARIILEGF